MMRKNMKKNEMISEQLKEDENYARACVCVCVFVQKGAGG